MRASRPSPQPATGPSCRPSLLRACLPGTGTFFAFLTAFAFLFATLPASAKEGHFEAIKKLYGFDDWDRKVSVRNGFPVFELAFDGWKGRDLFLNGGVVTRTFTEKDKPGAPPAFVVETYVGDTVLEAHQWLLGWLASRSDSYTLQALQDENHPKHKDQFGNLALTTREGPAGSELAIVFVRGNIGIRISAAHRQAYPELDLDALLGLGKHIDQQIQSQDVLPEGKKPARPRILKLDLLKRPLRAGSREALEFQVEDPAGKDYLTKWKVGGSARGAVRKDKAGNWKLRAERDGKLVLTAEVISSLGTYARRDLKLEVEQRPR